MKKIVLICLSAALIFGMYRYSPYHAEGSPKLELVQPEVGDIEDFVTLQGTIIDPELKKVYSSSPGIVTELCVQPGDRVSAGQLLMRIHTERISEEETAAAAMSLVEEQLERGYYQEALDIIESLSETDRRRGKETSATEIRSTDDGMLMRLYVQPGDAVHPMLPCAEIMNPGNLIMEAEADESVIGDLQEGMVCKVRVPAFSIFLPGTVECVEPYARKTGLLTGERSAKTTVQIHFPYGNSALRPGYRATAQVFTDNRKGALLLPYEAISQDDQNQEYLFKLRNGAAVKQKIKVGAELEHRAEILQGVSPYDLVILHPENVSEGERVLVALP